MTAVLATCQLNLPDREHFYTYINANAKVAKAMVTPGSATGRTVAICGAGPTLAETCTAMAWTDEVWAVNSALPYLYDRGVRVTHGLTIDQGEAMCAPEEFGRAPPVRYLLASSVHPALVHRLRAAHRRLTWFHSFLGIPDPEGWDRTARGCTYEIWLYRNRFPTSVMAGHGLNGVPRAVCLAMAMGFDHITVYGADCCCARTEERMPRAEDGDGSYLAWMARLQFYADGRTASCYGFTPMAEAEFDGRLWHTRADMVISAQHLVELAREYQRITFVGDTLPHALLTKDATWMADLPHLGTDGSVSHFRAAPVAA